MRKFIRKMKDRTLDAQKGFFWLWIVACFFLTIFFFEANKYLFQANLSQMRAPDFDGTHPPIVNSLNWVKAKAPEWKMRYDEVPESLLIPLPNYEPSLLAMSTDDLKWGNSEYDAIRNAKITFSVPYMGDYRLSGTENSGSHLAIDVKAIAGTPVHAISSGLVVKAADEKYGFGNHVVIRHDKVPEHDTLFSSYSHLESFTVAVGETVKKGQVIGYVGQTGTATTAHLHFQIDRKTAPWNPYWPFTSREASDAGLSFTEAINSGLGREKALEHTINPMEFVKIHQSGAVQNPPKTTSPVASTSTNTTNTTTNTSTNINPTDISPIAKIEFELIEKTNDIAIFELKFLNAQGASVDSSLIKDGISLSVNSLDIAELRENQLFSGDIIDGKARIHANLKSKGSLMIYALITGKNYKSPVFNLDSTDESLTETDTEVSTAEEAASLQVEFKGNFVPNMPLELTVKALGEDMALVSNYTPEEAVTFVLSSGGGNFVPSQLSTGAFKSGVAALEFIPDSNSTVRFYATDGKIKSEEITLQAGVFKDVSSSHPNYKAIRYLRDQGVIGGYDDGTFKPEKAISRVEVLKIILGALNYEKRDDSIVNFTDTARGTWYSPFLATAVGSGIVNGYPDRSFRPANNVNTAEFFKMLTLSTGEELEEEISEKPFRDVEPSDWFAPYAAYANKKRVLSSEKLYFDAGRNITRGEVADAIYRVLMIQKHGVKFYRDGLL